MECVVQHTAYNRRANANYHDNCEQFIGNRQKCRDKQINEFDFTFLCSIDCSRIVRLILMLISCAGTIQWSIL